MVILDSDIGFRCTDVQCNGVTFDMYSARMFSAATFKTYFTYQDIGIGETAYYWYK